MSQAGGRKRQRTTDGGAYHDPIDDDFSILHVREGRLKRTGIRAIHTAPSVRTTQHIAGSWSEISSWVVPDDHEYALDSNGDRYDELVEAPVMQEDVQPIANGAKVKKPKSVVAKRPHVVWMQLHRQTYLEEMLRWEGRGDFMRSESCPDCLARCSKSPGLPQYRCEDCFIPDLVCQTCCVKRHRVLPFHRIEQWDGTSFKRTSLKKLGLILQLNHSSTYCDNPIPCHDSMLILHVNGIHDVSVKYCGCTRAIPSHIQLLRRRLYPASQLSVKSCASFELLEMLHKFALTTKASTYDFYRALEKLTTGLGFDTPASRYKSLFQMVMQWRHLKMLKWAGRGNDPTGLDGTRPGDLAIRCPSCPIPGVNLPANWQEAPKEMQFLYMAIICMDANFRLKNQMVSNYSQDPGLGIGWSYMVPRAGQTTPITCVGFQALAKANTKFSVGLHYTGVSMATCGRSEMIMPLGVGNLQKGERYANMDYVFASAVKNVLVPLILISYDIACQWFVNLFKRMDEHWPTELRVPASKTLIPAIPKLHEPMHQTKGHQVFSLNFIPGVGLTDCECPERVWAPHNCLGNSTKTQGPGSRQDVLDDHFGFWNWLKYIGMGSTLLRKYQAAVADRNKQVEAHRGLTESVEKVDASAVNRWEKMCIAWEADSFPKKAKNPYHVEGVGISEAQIKKQLAEEEKKRMDDGGVALHQISAWSFVSLGLDLEEMQRRIRQLAKSASAATTDRKEGGLVEQRNVLRSRIKAWEQLLPVYLPGILQYQSDLAGLSTTATTVRSANPEDSVIWLPSVIPSMHRASVCQARLAKIEEKLRDAQLQDALDSLRRTLRVKTRMVQFKNKNIHGQRGGTRSHTMIDRVHEKARISVEKYRAARIAKMSLAGPGDWEKTYAVLHDADVRGYQDSNKLRTRQGRRGIWDDGQVEQLSTQQPPEAPTLEDNPHFLFNEVRSRRDGTGETRRTLSWIWLTESSQDLQDVNSDEILRVEWAKSRARAARAKEEVLLLKEEMRRVLQYLDWKTRWWQDRQSVGVDVRMDLAEGIRGYAIAQARVQESLAKHFKKLWDAPLKDPNNTATADAVETSRPGEITEEREDEAMELEELEELEEPEEEDFEDPLEYDSDNDL